LNDRTSPAKPDPASGQSPEGTPHTVTHVDAVSQRAAESADKKPLPHDTPHEAEASPVRNPADLEGTEHPGSSNPDTKQVPP